jgi:inner membrane protein
MDNLAHSLVGLAAAKAGLEKLSPSATAVCILAANAPDLDVLSGLFGDRWSALHYHRGLTHSIAGTLVLALIIPLIFYLVDLMVSRVRARPRRVRLRGLLLASLIASATHPLMDWTNNYGVRLLLPWSGRWFYGDLMFIVDPFLWLLFGATAFLLTAESKWQLVFWSLLAAILTLVFVYAGLLRGALAHPQLVVTLWVAALAVLVISHRLRFGPRWGSKIALAAFVLLFVYWGGLAFLHSRALNRASAVMISAANNGEQVIRLVAMPTLANPAHWQSVAETDRAVYRFDLYLIGDANNAPRVVRFEKPDAAGAKLIALASQDRRARIFLEFARFPMERVVDADCVTQTLVQFADLRYTEPGRSRGNFSLEVPLECPRNAVTDNGR